MECPLVKYDATLASWRARRLWRAPDRAYRMAVRTVCRGWRGGVARGDSATTGKSKVSCLFKKSHGPRPLHRSPSIFGKNPLQKLSFRDTLTHHTKQSVTPPTVHVRYIRYISYFPTDRDRLSFRDTRTHPRPTRLSTSVTSFRYIS